MKAFIPASLSLFFLFSPLAFSDDMAVDDADAFNPGELHKSKEGEIKVYDSETGSFFGTQKKEAVKAYEEKPPADSASASLPSNNTASTSTGQETKANVETMKSGKEKEQQEVVGAFDNEQFPSRNAGRFEIRTAYNPKAPNAVNNALNGLHQQMASHCPQGWIKQKEWSVAEQDHYFLHFEFECL